MKSMTGYGAARFTSGEVDVDVSVRAVNGRFLELRTQLPAQYAFLENEAKAIVSRVFRRGRVDLNVRRRPGPMGSTLQVNVQAELARQWIEGYKKLGRELRLMAEPNLDMVARLPDVLHFEERIEISASEKKQVVECIEKAVKSCDKEREREGQSIARDLSQLLASLQREVDRIYKLRSKAGQALRKKFKERLANLDLEHLVTEPRMMQEIALQIDRSDVSEEIARLKEHVSAFEGLISKEQGAGKKLDFYSQELLREVNTIGSKSQIAELTRIVVESKSIIEKIREQVQNIE
ncbi:MAG TPA: YicC/YloC family endoribonuclease [Bdellovibrionales bacterium]|nr:YicC/YloC family endoribonuclease [Bdellovibrionales bacterium]